MLLNKETHNIKYISFLNFTRYGTSKFVEISELSELVKLTDFGTRQAEQFFCDTYVAYADRKTPEYAHSIYLGDETTIKNEISKKVIDNVDINNISKIYFDPNCKYPRFKLDVLAGIKRSLNPAKADCVVITKDKSFPNYVSRPASLLKHSKILILYSKTEDCYYFVDYYPDMTYTKAYQNHFKLLLKPFLEYEDLDLASWAEVLIKCGVLPSDCAHFYYGSVVLTYNDEQTAFLNNLYTVYNNIILDTELDRLVSNNLQPITDDVLQTLSTMLSSNDPSTVDMGLKMLSGYDLRSHKCSVSTLLLYNWQHCKNSDVYISTGFRQVLQTLNIHPKTIDKYWIEYNINQLYEKCDNPDDLERTKQIIINHLENQIKRDWVEKYTFRYNGVNLTLNVKIE